MNRRTFLKIAGMGSIAFTTGCKSYPEKTLYSLVNAPDDMVTGKATWYASTCRECPAGCGVIAKNREGRIVKLEGNPEHPVNLGKLCMRGQSALQGLYDPDRLRQPLIKEKNSFRPISFKAAEQLLIERLSMAASKGKNRVRMITGIPGATLHQLMQQSLKQWNSDALLIYEPYAYEALKVAHEMAFGRAGLPAYAMDQCDFLIGFGADFLETWLSPIEYARKFKQMHALSAGRKGQFYQVSPYQSLTGANADQFLMCRPDTEAAVVLGFIRAAIKNGRGDHLPEELREVLAAVSDDYSAVKVTGISGIALEDFSYLTQLLLRSQKPLVLGLSAASAGSNAITTELAVVLLNLILDPQLSLYDFSKSYRVESAAKRSDSNEFVRAAAEDPVDLLLLHNTNPLYSIAPGGLGEQRRPGGENTFLVSFSASMDETALRSDLILPVATPLENWDEYGGRSDLISILQPAMGRLFQSPGLGELLLRLAFPEQADQGGYPAYLARSVIAADSNMDKQWLQLVQRGGSFTDTTTADSHPKPTPGSNLISSIESVLGAPAWPKAESFFIAAPSIRFFDGRGANKSWLAEIPDSTNQIAWQSVALIHPQTLAAKGLVNGRVVELTTDYGTLEAPVYADPGVHPQAVVMASGQGHSAYGRFAKNQGLSPLTLLPFETVSPAGHPIFTVPLSGLDITRKRSDIAHMDGHPYDLGRKIALTVGLADLSRKEKSKPGLTMHDFPMTLPLPEGYDAKRDIYPPHGHDTYRWGMVVDLDRCIGCGACSAACYAENNIGIVGEEQVINGREMSWIRIERYRDPNDPIRMTFIPIMCQHCDNAPCESVCPVYAPHHNKEGLNNQIYNRCIGTRFCAQNCPYKVRRFNWFTWQWPDPLPMQLNPNVTARSKGVMEKCSFCIQRIKTSHGIAKDEARLIRDGEVIPACVQTCPTNALTFGNLMDKKSHVMQQVKDQRAYQVMGYLNTKPAVIYLKKVVQNSQAISHAKGGHHT